MMSKTTRRFLVPRFFIPMAASVGAMTVVLLAPLSGQAPPKSSAAKGPAAPKAMTKAWVQPTTSWGDPDLQGLWPATDMINVPMQRPASFGTRAVLTDEEYAQ